MKKKLINNFNYLAIAITFVLLVSNLFTKCNLLFFTLPQSFEWIKLRMSTSKSQNFTRLRVPILYPTITASS